MEILKCPTCGKPLHKINKSYVCEDRHCYDIAKSGYANLLPPNRKRTQFPGDNPDMISARASLMDSGYYNSLKESILNFIGDTPRGVVLDIGCGEGVISRIIKDRYPEITVLGLDISKFAADAAAKRCKKNLYLVASSASLPVMDGVVDAVINTFAPIDIQELKRVLTPKGKLIKIVPAPNHLWQLKELLYKTPYKNPEEDFSPEGFTLEEKITVSDMITVKGEMINSLLQMTPYYYKTSKESIEQIISLPEVSTVLEFTVLCFVKN